MYTSHSHAAQVIWNREHFLGNWWSGLWRDAYIQVSASVMTATIVAALVMPSSDTITIIGGVSVAVLAGMAGLLKACLPLLEMRYKHKENMARMQAERNRTEMSDSSEVEDDRKTKIPPHDHAKVARVRRRRKDKPSPPEDPSEQNHESGQ